MEWSFLSKALRTQSVNERIYQAGRGATKSSEQHAAKSGRRTIGDLARAAGVSVATVDRVINSRLPVRPSTAVLVLEAARSIGFHATGVITHRVAPEVRRMTLGFILQRETTPFYRALGSALETATRAATAIQGRPLIEYLEDLSPAFVAERLRRMGKVADAVAIVAADHPYVSRAITDLHEIGRPTVALVSDLSSPDRAGYVGVDWRKAGRKAGWAMPKLAPQPGKVAIVVGSHRYQAHEICEISFRSYLREHAPGLELLEPLISLEEPRLAYESVLDLLKRTPDLAGIYSAGGGVEGVIQALREMDTHRHVAAICNELIDETREGLIDGIVDLVMSHPLPQVASAAVEMMREAVENGPSGQAPPRTKFVRMELYTPEDL
jgi:LacI family transcriptional regulator